MVLPGDGLPIYGEVEERTAVIRNRVAAALCRVVNALSQSNTVLFSSVRVTYLQQAYKPLLTTHHMGDRNIYLGGITSRANNAASYFPLDDGGGVPYFEDEWHGGLHEGFLAAICAEALNEVGLDETRSRERTVLSAHWSEAGLTLFGLPRGSHQIHVVDATGRLVFSQTTVSNGFSLITELPALADGAYVLNTASFAARFAVIR